LLTVSRSFMSIANSVLWKMAIILKANKVNLFVSSIFFWYHSPNFLDTSHKWCWKWCPWTIVSKNWIKQLHTLSVLHFNRCLTTEYS
jgi:hypothetical protein